jgi:hypothetical protein
MKIASYPYDAEDITKTINHIACNTIISGFFFFLDIFTQTCAVKQSSTQFVKTSRIY